MFRVVAHSPGGTRIPIGLGTDRLEHALQDRDELRAWYYRHKEMGWSVECEDGDGRVMDWADAETSVTAGDAA